MSDGIQVDTAALSAYAGQLGYYGDEAGKFEKLIDAADVTNEAWGVVGIFAKQGYTDRLAELRSLLDDMKAGVDALVTKVNQSAAMYEGNEEAGVIRFGQHEAEIDATGGQ
ncbi:MAG: type VII secretion target [Actinophytocola sp.]|uniref:type VII secretion target n=1 Tax=Actinophytocola sp. TaxID=1872138 RepID=UPI003C76103E